MPFRRAFLSLTRFPLWLSSAWLLSRHNLGGVTGEEKWKRLQWFLCLVFHFVKPYCYVSLVVQSNLHTLVVLWLSFTEEFRTIFRLRQKELEKKLNRPAKLSTK